MYLYKCKECGLFTSEEFNICPKCRSAEGKKMTNVDDEEGVIYKLTMDDVDMVIDNSLDDEEQEKIKKISYETLLDVMRRKIEIDYVDTIEAVLRSRLL